MSLAALGAGCTRPAASPPPEVPGASADSAAAMLPTRARPADPFAGERLLRFRHLTLADGLSQLDVNTIFQDSLGFMWFGTEDGLNRFDGRHIVVFRSAPFDTASLSSPWVVELVGEGGAGLWVATASGGLNRYDAHTQTFAPATVRGRQPLGNDLFSMIESRDGTLWLGARYDGLYHYNPGTGQVEHFEIVSDDRRTPVRVRIDALAEDLQGRIWVATHGRGLSRYDPARAVWTHYRTAVPGSLSSVAKDAAGNIWIGTRGSGLYRYRPGTDDFVRYRHAADPCSPGSDYVNALLPEPDGTLWVGLGDGLSRLDPATGCFTTYRHDTADPLSLPPGGVIALYRDRAGVVWVGTTEGVGFFERHPPPFVHLGARAGDPARLNDPEVWSIFEDRSGTLWVGTSGALNAVDPASGRVEHYTLGSMDPKKLSGGGVFGLYEDREGAFWVGTYLGGLHRFDRATGAVVERFSMRPDGAKDEEAVTPWGLMEDSRGRLWATAINGGCLSYLDKETRAFRYYCHDPDDPNTPAHDTAHDLVESRNGGFWLGTWGGGLDWFDADAKTFRHYRHDPANVNTPASDFVTTVHEDAQGRVWLGLYGGGLDRFDPVTDTFVHYNTANSDLPSDAINGIEEDARGDLWISTYQGLARLTPATGQIRTYGPEDGIQDVEFNNNASYRSSAGALYFGGIKGLTAFFPGRIEDDAFVPPVVLTAMTVRGQPASIGPGQVLSRAMPFTRSLRLRHNQRDIALTFAALHYVNPERNRFRYRLEGYDDVWYDAGSEQSAVYTNLAAGRYTFRVQAANSDGVWNEQAATLALTVLPPWWRTWWAYALYALLVLGVLYGIRRYELNRLRLKDRLHLEHLEAEKLRDLDAAKSRFFANVSHEFRTPLTLTLGPLDDLLGEPHGALPAPVTEQLQMVRRNARRLLGLINELLDVAKLEAGRMVLQKQRHDLVDFTGHVTRAYAALAERQGLAFHVEVPGAPMTAQIDVQQFEKAVGNLLSNALKFTPRGGTVTVRLDAGDSSGDGQRAWACLQVSDTGPGIPPAELPFVFDRFYQVSESETTLQPGTGIGLALARELVELHGGTLAVTSAVGVGTTFTLTLPLDDALPDDTALGSAWLRARARERAERLEDQLYTPLPVPYADAECDARDVTTVLIVEDNAEVRAYLARHLADAYRVLEARDGQEGLETTRAELPDLVIADVMMPRLGGVELCRALKRDPATDFIPVLLLTARAEVEDKIDALHERADDYLTKPFDVREVRARVDNLIESRRRWRERLDGEPATPSLFTGDDVFAEQVYRVIELHAADPDFGVALLAEQMDIDRSLLYRRLQHLDHSPAELIWEVRLGQAARLLAGRMGTVSEVAYGTGFKSVSHFSRRFREHYGVTPSEYSGGERA